MRPWYSKIIVVLMLFLVTLLINFRYQENTSPIPLKREIIIKEIRVPVEVKDTLSKDSSIITLPKEKSSIQEFSKYRRSRRIHKNVFIS